MNDFIENLTKGIEAMADPKVCEKMATLSWNLFQALKAKGFNEEQAMQLTIGHSKSTK